MDLAGSGVNDAMVTEGRWHDDVENDAEIEMELVVETSSTSPTTFTELYARDFQPLVRLATLMTGRVRDRTRHRAGRVRETARQVARGA